MYCRRHANNQFVIPYVPSKRQQLERSLQNEVRAIRHAEWNVISNTIHLIELKPAIVVCWRSYSRHRQCCPTPYSRIRRGREGPQ